MTITNDMKKQNVKKLVTYLIALAVFTLIGYGIPAVLKVNFLDVTSSAYIRLYLIGAAAPTLAALVLGKEERETMRAELKQSGIKRYFVAAPVLLFVHFALHGIRGYAYTLSFKEYWLTYITLFVGGLLSELGFMTVLRPILETRSGYSKGLLALGLIRSLWYVPIVYMPGTPINAFQFIYFCIGVVGANYLGYVVYSTTECIRLTSLFHAFLVPLSLCFMAKQDYFLAIFAIVEFIVGRALYLGVEEKKKEERQQERFRS